MAFRHQLRVRYGEVDMQRTVGERPVLAAVVTSIAVAPGTTEPTAVPEAVRRAQA